MNRNNLSRYILPILFSYIIIALAWWTVLLILKNEDSYQARKEMVLTMYADHSGDAFKNQILEIEKEHNRQRNMIIGEGIVFGLSIVLGLGYIFRAYKKELDLAERQKDFLLSVTHELNSPLASLSLVFETLKKRKLPKDKTSALYDAAGSEISRLNTLVNNILFAAKVEGNYRYNFEQIEIELLLISIIEKFKVKFPKHQFEYTGDIQDLKVEVDRETFISLINNLVENAVKYGKKRTFISVNLQNDSLVCAVADDGPGIEKKDREKIFQKFYRPEINDKKHVKGTGLGLFIAKEIVIAHGGSIEVKEQENGGARFEFILPQKQKK